jgi:hypothetical protein
LAGSPRTLPSGTDAAGGTAVTSKFYKPRDNLATVLVLVLATDGLASTKRTPAYIYWANFGASALSVGEVNAA